MDLEPIPGTMGTRWRNRVWDTSSSPDTLPTHTRILFYTQEQFRVTNPPTRKYLWGGRKLESRQKNPCGHRKNVWNSKQAVTRAQDRTETLQPPGSYYFSEIDKSWSVSHRHHSPFKPLMHFNKCSSLQLLWIYYVVHSSLNATFMVP